MLDGVEPAACVSTTCGCATTGARRGCCRRSMSRWTAARSRWCSAATEPARHAALRGRGDPPTGARPDPRPAGPGRLGARAVPGEPAVHCRRLPARDGPGPRAEPGRRRGAGRPVGRAAVPDPLPRPNLAELSKGTAQKVGLVQALIPRPDLLVLDEPWEGLDGQTRDLIPDIVGEVLAAGGSVLVSDHLGESAGCRGRCAGTSRPAGSTTTRSPREAQARYVIEIGVAAAEVPHVVAELRELGHEVLRVRAARGSRGAAGADRAGRTARACPPRRSRSRRSDSPGRDAGRSAVARHGSRRRPRRRRCGAAIAGWDVPPATPTKSLDVAQTPARIGPDASPESPPHERGIRP